MQDRSHPAASSPRARARRGPDARGLSNASAAARCWPGAVSLSGPLRTELRRHGRPRQEVGAREVVPGRGSVSRGLHECTGAGAMRSSAMYGSKAAFLACAVAALPSVASGHASYLLQPARCPRQLELGATIMGQETVLGSGTLSIGAYSNGGSYSPGEAVEVVVAGVGNAEVIMQTSAGAFSTGARGCDDTRVTAASATLTLPNDGPVTIVALWASRHGAVSVAEPFTLSMSTTDPCAPLDSDGASCDDGSSSTVNDVCLAGACAGTPGPCVGVVCAPAASDCHVAGFCTDGVCSAETVAADGTSCDDGDTGTVGDMCTSGQCAGTASQTGTLDTSPQPVPAASSAPIAWCGTERWVVCLFWIAQLIGSIL